MFKPKITNLGLDFAGVVEAVGSTVTLFKTGDQVFGLSPNEYGAHAEYLCIPEVGAGVTIPDGVDFAEAVLCEGAWYANNNLEKYDMQPGDQILIFGGGGAIGPAAVQLAKFYGAKVTSVVETRHIELVKSLGADHVIDFTREDFTESGKIYDFVFDAVGKTSYSKCKKFLSPKGTFSASDLGPYGQNIWLALWSQLRRNKRVIFPMPICSKAVIEFIKSRVEAGELHAVIDSRYPLESIVEAYRRVDTEQKTGIVVIDVAEHES
jgi:NADPH:quinone reductase-like Zn-dependent oxidoreductase